jgi:serine phosphatase RsbU (regulator of sigma subunit)
LRRQNDRLREVARQIQRDQELESGLKSARKKQLHMLPSPPTVPGYEFGCYYSPASSLGGDFYDFVEAPGGRLGIAIGDVTGHGVDAAIVMGMAKKTLNIFGKAFPTPRDVLVQSNESLFPDLDDMTFVSATYSVLDPATGRFEFARAGHNPALLCLPLDPPQIVPLKPKGIVLGMQKNEVFANFTEGAEIVLAPGQIVLQYTDGIVEAKNRAGTEYGLERLEDLLRKHVALPATQIVAAIQADFSQFSEGVEQDDDITLVVLKVLAPEAEQAGAEPPEPEPPGAEPPGPDGRTAPSADA